MGHKKVYEPSPEIIHKKCIEIQNGWSDTERRRRNLFKAPARWLPPEVIIDTVLQDKIYAIISDYRER